MTVKRVKKNAYTCTVERCVQFLKHFKALYCLVSLQTRGDVVPLLHELCSLHPRAQRRDCRSLCKPLPCDGVVIIL